MELSGSSSRLARSQLDHLGYGIGIKVVDRHHSLGHLPVLSSTIWNDTHYFPSQPTAKRKPRPMASRLPLSTASTEK